MILSQNHLTLSHKKGSVDYESIIQIAVSTAKHMGLNASDYETQLRSKLEGETETYIHRETSEPRTYTLEFLRALMEGSDEFKSIPKVGTEAPRNNTLVVHQQQKGKYKPHIISTHCDSSNNVSDDRVRKNVYPHDKNNISLNSSRDIVRSNNVGEKIVANIPTPPRGENAWIPTKAKKENEDDPVKLKFNKIRSDLNKISPDNELIIADRICDEIIEECVADIIPVFFDKGVWEQKYREIYVRLCVKLSAKFPGVFLSALLTHTQHEFETRVLEDAEDDEIVYAMKRRIGAAYFIIEMLKVKLVKPDIVVLCAEKILGSEKEKSDYDICHVAELVIISVSVIKNKDIIGKLRALISILENLYLSQYVSQRAKFKVEDAVKVFKK